jgi:stage V sporulation protein SpoVS
MIIVGGKFTGKKLVNAIIKGITTKGSVEVAALSDRGVHQINFAGQKVANSIGNRISAVPAEGEVTIDGVHRIALVVTFSKSEEKK